MDNSELLPAKKKCLMKLKAPKLDFPPDSKSKGVNEQLTKGNIASPGIFTFEPRT